MHPVHHKFSVVVRVCVLQMFSILLCFSHLNVVAIVLYCLLAKRFLFAEKPGVKDLWSLLQLFVTLLHILLNCNLAIISIFPNNQTFENTTRDAFYAILLVSQLFFSHIGFISFFLFFYCWSDVLLQIVVIPSIGIYVSVPSKYSFIKQEYNKLLLLQILL